MNCQICEKKGERDCPALGGLICRICCGLQRGSKIQCPADCSYSPFGLSSYHLLRELWDRTNTKKVQYLKRKTSEQIFLNAFMQMGGASSIETVRMAAMENALYWLFLGKRDSRNKTLFETWEAEKWQGLSNDEINTMKCFGQTCPTIVETGKALDTLSTRCVDLLNSERGEFLLYDKGVAKLNKEGVRTLLWLTPCPNYCVVSSGALVPGEVYDPYVAELRARAEKAAMPLSEYLLRRFSEVITLLFEMNERHAKTKWV